jgi:protein O-mannosyl-transferase
MRLHLHRLIFFVILISIVFSPSIFAELSTCDDFDMYHQIAGSEFSFRSVFFPQSAGGAYYRPLIGISYLFDKYVWLLDTRLMHLDNIFFHVINSALVYFLVLQLLPSQKRSESHMPLAAALLFGLHPITSESVNWISGRTDIFACTFVLLTTWALLKFRETKRYSFLLLAPFLLIPGMLVKETPMVFILCALFILSAENDGGMTGEPSPVPVVRDVLSCFLFSACAIVLMVVTYNVWYVFIVGLAYLGYEALVDIRTGRPPIRVKSLLLVILAGAGAIWVFFFVRSVVFRSSLGSIPRTIKLIVEDLNYALQTFLGAAGFYVKKFFLPLPLNLAIREIDPLYNLAGIVVFMFCLYLMRKNKILSALFLSGICLFLPALPLSLGTVTWTGYAERYIYMSSAFWVIVMTLWLGRIAEDRGKSRLAFACTASIISLMAILSFQRSMTWKTNLSLWRDTVAKSPGFKMIRVDYMLALINSGDLNEAKKQYRFATAIRSVNYYENLDLAFALVLSREGKYDESARIYEQAIKKTKGKSVDVYERYVQFLRERLGSEQGKSKEKALALAGRQLECLEALYVLNKDPLLLYRAGQLSLFVGDRAGARRYFKKALDNLPATSEYSGFASKLFKKL